ncbi:MAG TPA: magnesium/cobalt transporter CorA [Ktedonobacteraceae bacterium]|jgi:magnesium transporter|nr:magnesium/cobalt transporter CorA [Ktedonobacteraceae bacterium]
MQQQEQKPLKPGEEQGKLLPAQQQELRVIAWKNGQLSTDIPLETLPEILLDPHTLVWLDITGDCSDCETQLCDIFKLEPIIVKTMCEEHERAKFLERDNYFYLVVHGMTFDPATGEAVTPKLDVVFAKNSIITSHRVSFEWIDKLQQEAREKDSGEHIMSRGMPFLLYTLLDALVDSYFPVLDDIDDIIDDLEDEAVSSGSNDVQVRIFRMKRTLAQLRRVISPQIEVANALIARTGKLIPAKAEPYFADVHDHLVRAFEILDSYRDLMSGMLDVYLTTVSNRLNVVMKQLAIIATIFMPITFITGVFGQNFGHLPQVEHDNGYLFWYVLAGMAVITAIQILYFKRRGWL